MVIVPAASAVVTGSAPRLAVAATERLACVLSAVGFPACWGWRRAGELQGPGSMRAGERCIAAAVGIRAASPPSDALRRCTAPAA